jgi:hypothetical protein
VRFKENRLPWEYVFVLSLKFTLRRNQQHPCSEPNSDPPCNSVPTVEGCTKWIALPLLLTPYTGDKHTLPTFVDDRKLNAFCFCFLAKQLKWLLNIYLAAQSPPHTHTTPLPPSSKVGVRVPSPAVRRIDDVIEKLDQCSGALRARRLN